MQTQRVLCSWGGTDAQVQEREVVRVGRKGEEQKGPCSFVLDER